MIQINLLPVKAKKKRETGRQFALLYFLCILLGLGAIGYIWYSQKTEIERLQTRLAQVEREVQQYAKFEALLADLKKRKDVLDKQRTVIKDLQRDRDTIVRMMALLSVEIPADRMWFERFTQGGSGITLDGVALSNEAIAEFMRNLESSPYIVKGSVSLTHSRQVTMSAMKLREFQVTYQFLPFSQVQNLLKQPS